MGAHAVILLNVYADCLAQSPGVGIFIEVDFLCFEAAEPPLNHHVVRPPGLSVHTQTLFHSVAYILAER